MWKTNIILPKLQVSDISISDLIFLIIHMSNIYILFLFIYLSLANPLPQVGFILEAKIRKRYPN